MAQFRHLLLEGLFVLISEGVVPGGATAYLRVRAKISDLEAHLTDEEYFGAELVYRALEAPLRMLVDNSGGDPGAVVDKVVSSDKGYDVETQELEDLVEHGILGPVKVLRTALDNAGKVATALLTTSVLITIKRKEDDTTTNG